MHRGYLPLKDSEEPKRATGVKHDLKAFALGLFGRNLGKDKNGNKTGKLGCWSLTVKTDLTALDKHELSTKPKFK